MSRIGKGIGVVGGVLLLALGIAGWWIYGHLGQIVEDAVEAHGPAITGTPVSLGGATLSIFSGEGALRGLTVGNPEVFSDNEAFELGKIETAIDVGSLAGEVVRVRSIVIDGPRLLAEFDEKGASNLRTILDHARGASRGGGAAKESGGSGPPKKLIIEQFIFSNAELRVVAPAFKVDKTLKLDTIRLRNLGGQGGATAADIGRQILQPVIDEALRAAKKEYAGQKRDELREKAEEKLEELFN